MDISGSMIYAKGQKPETCVPKNEARDCLYVVAGQKDKKWCRRIHTYINYNEPILVANLIYCWNG